MMSENDWLSTILRSLRVLWPAFILIFIEIENPGSSVAHGSVKIKLIKI